MKSKYVEFRNAGRARCEGKKKAFNAVVEIHDDYDGTITPETVKKGIDRDALFNLRVELWAIESELQKKLNDIQERLEETQALIEDSETLA